MRMPKKKLQLLKDHVITRCRNGRCYYDPAVKQALIRHAAAAGVSLARLAQEHGIGTGLLRRWVKQEQKLPRPQRRAAPAEAFIPVTLATPVAPQPMSSQSFCARLPNGIEIDPTHMDAARMKSLLEVLWELPCSVSTRT